MKFGIIGFGKIARKFVKSITYTDEGKVIAIGSHSLDENDHYLINHPNVRLYRDYNEMLADENIDAVYIAVPHQYHLEWIIKSLQAKKAVLCEKPAVLDEKCYETIKQVAKENNTYFLEAFKTVFNPGFSQLKKDLALIGSPITIEDNFCYKYEGSKSDTYLFDKDEGGALYDIGTYTFGFIQKLVNSSIVDIDTDFNYQDGIDLSFEAHLEFEDGTKSISKGSIIENEDRVATITGPNGRIIIPYYNRITDYVIELSDDNIKRKFNIKGDDMTLEIQCLINDVKKHKLESNIFSIEDSRKLIETINRVKNN
ncbi:MAG: Gfo/Idh/MocA family oxidoreductase [Thomasclavelia sp.]|nr:Gfo/Idh/MocA family oxidoreductase [Thomasclavelia sp.]